MNDKYIYFESYGCPANRSDGEAMMKSLEEAGYTIVENYESADILIVHTCGVKKPTEDKILYRLQCLKQTKIPLIISGCLPKINMSAIEKIFPNNLSVLGPFSIDHIVEAVKGIELGVLNQQFFTEETFIKVKMPKRRTQVYDIIPISEGCLGACSFCCTRFARGQLVSYPPDIIVNTITESINLKIKEIWLTAQDTGAYGLDIGFNLADLLSKICKIEGDFYIRVGMMNPKNIMNILFPLTEAYRSKKVFKFLHLPIQSGSDAVLKRMNRLYTVSDFRMIVQTFRKAIPDLSISTDIICGFPGELNTDFEASLCLLREIEPDIVNISKFFPRPKTLAAEMKQLSNQTVKTRSKKMTELCKILTYKRNKNWLDWSGEILVDEIGTGSSMIGRNFAYKPIIVNGKTNLLGKKVRVKVKKVTPTYLLGEILQ